MPLALVLSCLIIGVCAALQAYLARRGEGLTVIAGYPWFLDWGRDTLIVCRGLLAYLFSLAFTIGYGYWAAKDHLAEKVLIPMLDEAYPVRADGVTYFPFRRIFVVAQVVSGR